MEKAGPSSPIPHSPSNPVVTVVPYETQFQQMIKVLNGSHKLSEKRVKKNEVYSALEIECTSNGFTYSGKIFGDVFQNAEEARENVFQKALEFLRRRYYMELKDWEKKQWDALKRTGFN